MLGDSSFFPREGAGFGTCQCIRATLLILADHVNIEVAT